MYNFNFFSLLDAAMVILIPVLFVAGRRIKAALEEENPTKRQQFIKKVVGDSKRIPDCIWLLAVCFGVVYGLLLNLEMLTGTWKAFAVWFFKGVLWYGCLQGSFAAWAAMGFYDWQKVK